MSKTWIDFAPSQLLSEKERLAVEKHSGSYSVVPRAGESVDVGGLSLTVVAVAYSYQDGDVIASVRVK